MIILFSDKQVSEFKIWPLGENKEERGLSEESTMWKLRVCGVSTSAPSLCSEFWQILADTGII